MISQKHPGDLFVGIRFRKIGAAFLLCAFLSSAPPAHAKSSQIVEMLPACGVKITIDTCFETTPPAGCAPMRVEIENFSGSTRSWTLDFSSGQNYGGGQVRALSQTLTVENSGARSFDLLVPLSPRSRTSYSYNQLTLGISGYGVKQKSLMFRGENYSGKPHTAFVAMSDALATHSWGPLQKEIEWRGHQLSGSLFDPEFLPSDWRGWLGAGCVWITETEWAKLIPEAKAAVEDWIAQGGRLFLCTENENPELLARYEATGAASARHGFGSVTLVMWKGRELDTKDVAQKIDTLEGLLEDQLSTEQPVPFTPPFSGKQQTVPGGYGTAWKMRADAGALAMNVPLLISFMVSFGIVVGPLNLFFFARSGQRHRLFWTTPIISIAAGAMLVGVIILQDGFGGSGRRLVFVNLLPEQKEVVMQEQISRTGVLLSQSFKTSADVFLAPISLRTSNNQRHQYSQSGGFYGGDWFSSRALQGQFAEAVRPTRARIELLNAQEVREKKAAPVVLSSIGVTLEEMRFVDENKRVWQAQNVRTGEKTALRETSQVWPRWCRNEAGTRIGAAIDVAANGANFFYATAENVKDAALDASPAIRWTWQRAIYAGKITPVAK